MFQYIIQHLHHHTFFNGGRPALVYVIYISPLLLISASWSSRYVVFGPANEISKLLNLLNPDGPIISIQPIVANISFELSGHRESKNF